MHSKQIKSNSIPGNGQGLVQISEVNVLVDIYLVAG